MQKLLKLEEVEVKAEEEPEGKAIVGSSGEAPRPPSKGTTFTWRNFLSECIWTAAPLVVFYIRSFLVLGETSEEEGEVEEPEISTKEHARFDWACIWMEEGVHNC